MKVIPANLRYAVEAMSTLPNPSLGQRLAIVTKVYLPKVEQQHFSERHRERFGKLWRELMPYADCVKQEADGKYYVESTFRGVKAQRLARELWAIFDECVDEALPSFWDDN